MKSKFKDATNVYREEFEYVFSNKAMSVRGATVISALIEWQVIQLTTTFLQSKGIIHRPEPRSAYHQSLNILIVNNVLDEKIIKNLNTFRRQRNKSIHGIFKNLTREEWAKQNEIVVKLGRLIVQELDQKL